MEVGGANAEVEFGVGALGDEEGFFVENESSFERRTALKFDTNALAKGKSLLEGERLHGFPAGSSPAG
jgi:hypothetical protein